MSAEGAEGAAVAVGREATMGELLAEVQKNGRAIAALQAKFDEAADQIGAIAEVAGPAIEQLTASPVMRMLTGGKRGK